MNNNLLERNIYDVKGRVLICGSCLPDMEKQGFNELKKDYDTVLFLCLEREHVNMAITKLGGILATGNVLSLAFASVNKSPHCTQLHYIKKELKRMLPEEKIPEIKNFVIADNKIYSLDDDVLALSKDLVKLSNLMVANK